MKKSQMGFAVMFAFCVGAMGCAAETGQGDEQQEQTTGTVTRGEVRNADDGAGNAPAAAVAPGDGDQTLGRSTAGRSNTTANQKPRLQ